MYELSYRQQTCNDHVVTFYLPRFLIVSFPEIVDILVRLKAFLLTMLKRLMTNTQ